MQNRQHGSLAVRTNALRGPAACPWPGLKSGTVTLCAARPLTHHALQNTQQLMVTKVRGNDSWAKHQRKFVKNLEKEAQKAGITKPLVTFEKYGDIWAQDFVEPAYLNMTGPDGRQRTMRVMLRSAQDREAGRELYEKLRGPNVGVVQAKGRDMQGWETRDPAVRALTPVGVIEGYVDNTDVTCHRSAELHHRRTAGS